MANAAEITLLFLLGFLVACGGQTAQHGQQPATKSSGAAGEIIDGSINLGGTRNGVGGAGASSGGAISSAGSGTVGICRTADLASAPAPFASCVGEAWLCPHSRQLSDPTYGPFTSCCPYNARFSCPNGTPNSCYATAEEAAAACGTDCVACAAPGGNGTGNQDCIDLSQLPTTPAVSFRNDLMPIFGLSCTASSCHDLGAHKADLVLGDPSACAPNVSCFDPAAKWNYSFPGPIPDALLSQVYSNLVSVPSVIAPGASRVFPGDPNNSFLLDTVMGTQNSKWYTPQCKNTDPSTASLPCGGDMPFGTSGGFCADSPKKVEAIAMWIAQGAAMN